MNRLVDPFIPATTVTATAPMLQREPAFRRVKRRGRPTAAAISATKPRISTITSPTRTTTTPQHTPRHAAQQFRPYAIPPAQKQRLGNHPRLRHALTLMQVPAIVIGSLAAGILAQSAILGQGILLLYALVALAFRIDSRTTFLAAFLLLCGLVGLLVFRANNTMAVNFAVYLFILLFVGVISLWRELRERYV